MIYYTRQASHYSWTVSGDNNEFCIMDYVFYNRKKAKSPNNFYQNNFNKKRKYKKNVKHDCDSINPKKPIHLIKIIIF